MSLLRRLEWFWDESELSRTKGARRIRLVFGILFGFFAVAVAFAELSRGDWNLSPILLAMTATAIATNRGGRFAYYFLPVALGLWCYMLAAQAANSLKLTVHYLPQLDLERILPGPLPTVWLQEHLYRGSTGPLEVFALVMYLSHFVVPLLVGFALAMSKRGRAFASLMFTILTAAALGEITFVLAPTAPPWLAAEHGLLPGVHHLLKETLYGVHLTKIGDFIGDPTKYDITAAVPSLHAAFPIICLLVVRKYGLPGWMTLALALNFVGVVFSIVYLGDHYLVDAIAGVLYAFAAWRLVERLLRDSTSRATAGTAHDRGQGGVPALVPARD